MHESTLVEGDAHEAERKDKGAYVKREIHFCFMIKLKEMSSGTCQYHQYRLHELPKSSCYERTSLLHDTQQNNFLIKEEKAVFLPPRLLCSLKIRAENSASIPPSMIFSNPFTSSRQHTRNKYEQAKLKKVFHHDSDLNVVCSEIVTNMLMHGADS